MVFLDPEPTTPSVSRLPKITHTTPVTYFAADLAQLKTPRTFTPYTLLKSLMVNSRAGFTTEIPAFCDIEMLVWEEMAWQKTVPLTAISPVTGPSSLSISENVSVVFSASDTSH